MRFFILSDLHLSADESPDATACQVKKLCAKIRTDIALNEHILFILLGDIADRGNPQSFSVGRSILSLIKTELNEYTVQFMFTPGNHQVLPFANGELLLEISIHCKDISQNALRDAMEREYKKSPTLNLQTHLITYGSEMAVDDYVKQVMRDMFPPEKDKTLSDGPTVAISTLHDCKFLPQLESLLIVKMDSSFSDCTWHSLSNALITAFANCGINSKGVAIEIIEKHRPSANEDEKNYRYCNYVIEEIKRIARLQEDRAYSLADTKKILSTIALTD